MDVFESIKKRYSVRSYKDLSVEKEKIVKIIEAARLAPSAKNRQPWRFIIIRDIKIKEELYVACKYQEFVRESPVVIAAIATSTDYVMSCGIPAHYVDLSIAVTNMMLIAVEQGLGSCWIGAFYQDKVKEILEIKENEEIVALLTVGYPAVSPHKKNRKAFNSIVEWK